MTIGLNRMKNVSLSLALMATCWLGTVLFMGDASADAPEGNVARKESTAASESPKLEVVVAPANPAPVIRAQPVLAANEAAKPGEKRADPEQEIAAALDKPARMEFIETPLNDVIDFLRDEHEIPIQLDKKALEDEGVDTATPITMNLAGVSLRSALRVMLEPLNLTYVVKNEILVITTSGQASKELVPKIYQVGDLLEPEGNAGSLQALADLISQTVIGFQAAEVNQAPRLKSGGVVPFRKDLLVISQSRPVHEQIELFLRDLRKQVKQ